MEAAILNPDIQNNLKMLPKGFNKKKFTITYNVTTNPNLQEIQNLSKVQCLGKKNWPQIDTVKSWMISSETATFMKWGGLGMVASELPEAFNNCFGQNGDVLTVVTPMYLGDTGKKKAELNGNVYCGAEHRSCEVKKIKTIEVPFLGERSVLVKYKVNVYTGTYNGTPYIFLSNDRFFDINPHENNPSAQDGCYVLNRSGINEVERFAFFSKAVYVLLKTLCSEGVKGLDCPNVVIANDWHLGALSGLMKYFTTAQVEAKMMDAELAEKIRKIPVVHIAHHLGYQGWDYDNTVKILNSLYENLSMQVLKNAKAIKNSNPRATNTLIVHDCYNQASCNFHLADRVVTVSKNYLEEVSKDVCEKTGLPVYKKGLFTKQVIRELLSLLGEEDGDFFRLQELLKEKVLGIQKKPKTNTEIGDFNYGLKEQPLDVEIAPEAFFAQDKDLNLQEQVLQVQTTQPPQTVPNVKLDYRASNDSDILFEKEAPSPMDVKMDGELRF